jgi:anti-sigma-K factor RskA
MVTAPKNVEKDFPGHLDIINIDSKLAQVVAFNKGNGEITVSYLSDKSVTRIDLKMYALKEKYQKSLGLMIEHFGLRISKEEIANVHYTSEQKSDAAKMLVTVFGKYERKSGPADGRK